MEILIFDEITEAMSRDVLQKIRATPRDPLVVFVNSYGGSAAAGLAIYNALREHAGSLRIEVTGLAASAATLICCAGHCVAHESAVFMLHDPAVAVEGDAKKLQQAVDCLNRFAESARQLYAEKTKRPVAEIHALLEKGDSWLSAAEALALGLIDEIIPGNRTAVRFGPLTPPVRFTAMQPLTVPSPAPAPFPIPPNPPTPSMMSPQAIAHACQAAGAPGLISQLLAQPMTEHQVAERLSHASTIRTVAARMDLAFMADRLIEANVHPDQASKILWDADVARDRATVINSGHGIGPVKPYGGHDFITRASNALAVRMGARPGPAASDTREFQNASLTSLAALTLNAVGVDCVGMSRPQLVKMAMTTSDFPNLLSVSAQKSLLDRFEALSTQHRQLCSLGSLPDFKSHDVVNTSFLPGLLPKDEAAEIQYGALSDGKESIRLATFARGLVLSREALINDDLDVFTDLIASAANAAARTECDLVYGLLTGNPAMSDGVPLFHVNHGNLDSAGTVINAASLSTARTLMRKQKDSNGGYVMTQPRFLICPVGHEGDAEALIAALTYRPANDTEIETPAWIKSLVVVADPRLDAANADDWYLLSAPPVAPVIRLSHLNGMTAPVVEEDVDFSRDVTRFKIRFDVGVAAIGWAGAVKMA